jgi:hypothetical protein
MSLQANLLMARLAVNFVQRKMTVGASNKFGDITRSFGGSLLCVRATRSVDIAVPRGPIPTWLREWAAKAEHVGCGNCGEQAALAFMDLHERHHVRPLDYMARTNRDHAFVLIGRVKGSKIDDHKTWGKDAVVCDPWNSNVYSAGEIPTKAYGGARPFGVESLFRID